MDKKKTDKVNANNYIMIQDDCGLNEEQIAQRRAEEKRACEKNNQMGLRILCY